MPARFRVTKATMPRVRVAIATMVSVRVTIATGIRVSDAWFGRYD